MHFKHQHDVPNLPISWKHLQLQSFKKTSHDPGNQSSYASYMHQFQGHIRMQEKITNNWKLGASANQPSCIDLGNVQTLRLKRSTWEWKQ